MRIVFFVHSLISDWNHGNAHFLRGLMRSLRRRGHDPVACERWRNWSCDQLFADHGARPVIEFARRFPDLEVRSYGRGAELIDEVDELTRGAELVLVHEFNEPAVVAAVAEVRRRRGDFLALFHDTHHRAVSARHEIACLPLGEYDGVLAFGASLAEVYRAELGVRRVWTFHEAADTTVFRPLEAEREDDVVWIGNWGDEERSREIRSYLIDGAKRLPELRFRVHGVRYPELARREIDEARIEFGGWIANYRVPEAFARARVTLHIPRGPYLGRLAGIPTIRPFEALACGIPLIMTPWEDREGLFDAGRDYIAVRSPEEAHRWIQRLVEDEEARGRLTENGLETVLSRHTCDHRAEQLEAIHEEAAAIA